MTAHPDNNPTVHGARRARAILTSARELFCEQGFEATSMATIAGRVGVVEGTLYKYFDNKRALLLAVLEDWYEQLMADDLHHLEGVSGTFPRLRLLIWLHLRTMAEWPTLCSLMLQEVRSEPGYHGSRLHRLNRQYTNLLLDVLRDGVEKGEIRDDLPLPLFRDMVYGGIEHYTWMYRRDDGALDIDSAADHILSLLHGGIGTTPNSILESTDRLSHLVERLEKNLA